MNVIIVSGLSGSGKTVVLNTLEDIGYYCIDNMNPQILKDHIQDYIKYDKKLFDKIAFGIDIRTGLKSFEEIPYLQKEIENNTFLNKERWKMLCTRETRIIGIGLIL